MIDHKKAINNNYNNNYNSNNNNNNSDSDKLNNADAQEKLIPVPVGAGAAAAKVQPMELQMVKEAKPKKKKRRDKSDLGDDFVPPEGGWGWVVAIASGVNILVTFALAQQFGIIFGDRMKSLGIISAELTSIINIQIAVSAFTGLLNGPLFRRYTFRVVALVGSVLTFLGLFIMAFANTFQLYVLSFSIIYGFGRGLTVSASSLAVNTYFKKRRRTATAYQFGVAGLGPIVCPYLATYLVETWGVLGTVLFFAGASLHTIACSLIYQPVKWHVVKRPKDAEALNADEHIDPLEEEIIKEVVEPETPVLPRANDGWYGSRLSLNSSGTARSRHRSSSVVELKRLNSCSSAAGKNQRSISVSYSIQEEDHMINDDDDDDEYTTKQDNDNSGTKPLPSIKTNNEDNQGKMIKDNTTATATATATIEDNEIDEEERRKKLPFYKKIIIFFDLDLLRDITYVNLSVGLTLINFVEINFAILTPLILKDLGFEKAEIAMAMSLLGFCDLVIRFAIPLILLKAPNFSNRTFFVIGILGMCLGRALLSRTSNFYVMIAIFIWMGLNKAFRTVFWSLIIPSHVELKRLPAAAGLQLLMSGTFSLACGPLIGLIRDNSSYAVTLNVLNALCIVAIVLWFLEDCIRARRRKSQKVIDMNMK